MKHIVIYTDGACRGNPGPGGWGAILRYGEHEKILSGAETATTNNRMEMLAAINALKALTESCQIDLYTDSQYLHKGITQWLSAWKKRGFKTANNKKVKNADLWTELELLQSKHQMTWHWIKGHNGHPHNEHADKIANDAIDILMLDKGTY